VIRNGAAVAIIAPPRARLASAERFREVFAAAPPIDDDLAENWGNSSPGRAGGELLAVLIDTGLLVERERGAGSAPLEESLGDEERAISVITVSELLHGVHRAGARRAKRRAFVEHVLAAFEPIPVTETVVRVHAEIWAVMAGDAIGAYGLWIAATALTHGLGGATLDDADFGRVPCLRVVVI
jgi:tRNA(fMet)-specific endonuclease VapC